MNYGPQNQGPGNCGTTKGVEKIVEESDLVLQSQHFLTTVIASIRNLIKVSYIKPINLYFMFTCSPCFQYHITLKVQVHVLHFQTLERLPKPFGSKQATECRKKAT